METISGNLVRDAVNSTRNVGGKEVFVTNFTVAENLNRGGKDFTRYIKVAVWRNWGEAIAPYLKAGKKVTIEGYLESEGWVGQDGKARSNLLIRTPHSIKLEGKKMESPEATEADFAGAEA